MGKLTIFEFSLDTVIFVTLKEVRFTVVISPISLGNGALTLRGKKDDLKEGAKIDVRISSAALKFEINGYMATPFFEAEVKIFVNENHLTFSTTVLLKEMFEANVKANASYEIGKKLSESEFYVSIVVVGAMGFDFQRRILVVNSFTRSASESVSTINEQENALECIMINFTSH